MRFGTALAFIATVVFPLQLKCTGTITCQDYVEGHCPVKLIPIRHQEPGEMYAECVTVRVWIKADDFCEASKIEILSTYNGIYKVRPVMEKRKNKAKCNKRKNTVRNKISCNRCVTQQLPRRNTSFALWELKYDCVKADANSNVSVSYNTASKSCNVSYTVPDPVPEFNLSVNPSSKSITVTVAPGEKVYTRWCYSREVCVSGTLSPQVIIDPSQSQSAVLNIPYMLPCVCVQVYYTYTDAYRDKKCPFQRERLADVGDVWSSSEIILYKSSLQWRSECPASDLKISASLCWRQHEHLCTPVLNSTLEETEDGTSLIYNISTVDKHPNMCFQFSLQGSHNISCRFKTDLSSWEVHIGTGRQSVFVYLTSLVPAMFSAQFCVLEEKGCSPIGPVQTLRAEEKTTETKINMPSHFLVKKPCVQVWQSDPALHGRRILCPVYTHHRYGFYAVAALILMVFITLMGIFIHQLTKTGVAGWLSIQKPILLVCSSEQSAHVSAVCALGSILQGELSATVHMALWAQSSQRQTGSRTGVADLGPLPWLYGQWEYVRKAQGNVLIIWSPEAKMAYENWKDERANVDQNKGQEEDDNEADERNEKIRVAVEEHYKLNGRRQNTKYKKKKAGGRKDCIKLCDGKDWYPQKESSSVTATVFAAALACLQGTLQQYKGQGVVIVYFQGHGHSKDIPKALRSVPRYCLPQDFRGLIQELGGMKRRTQTAKYRWHCWPRLLSKVRSIWLARQLAHRLQTQLLQTRE